MAIRISQLPTATTVDGNEFIVIVQNGVTKKITIGETLFEGEQGPAGTGYVFKGNWSSITGYVVNDVVVYNGSSYVSKVNNNVNHTPGDNTYWGVVALKGDTGAAGATGATGATGAQGPQGAQGPVGSLDIGSNVINNLPDAKPSLDLNFEHQGILDGRMSFSRGSEATYFDEFGILKIAATDEPVFDRNPETLESKGLYVAGPSTDLVWYSAKDDFNNWTKLNATVDSNVEVAPDGTLTADRLSANTTGGAHYIYESSSVYATNRKDYTFSVFAKKGSNADAQDIIQLIFAGTTFGSPFANFDLSNGKITRVSSNARAQMIKLPNGWYRIAITVQAQVSSNAVNGGFITFCNNNPLSDFAPSYIGSIQQDIFIWGPQHEEGAKLTPYKYTNNSSTYAQAIQAWTLIGVTTSVNSGYAPDGTFTAERVIETAANEGHYLSRSVLNLSVSIGQVATAAVYLKKGIGSSAPDNVHFRFTSTTYFTGGWGANFNLTSGIVNSIQGNASASIENVGNGWYKCTISAIATTAHTITPLIAFVNNDPNSQSAPTYAGSTNSDLYAWGLHAVLGYNLPEYIRKAGTASVNAPTKLPLKEGSLVVKAEVTQEQTAFDTRSNETNTMASSHYLFDNKSGNNRLSLYARKPNNLINTSYSLISRNLFSNSEGGLSTFSSISSGLYGVRNSIEGFDSAIVFPANDASRNAYKSGIVVSGEIYTLSMFIQMDDGGAPVIGLSSSDSSGDFVLIMHADTLSSDLTVTQVSGSLYRISGSRTAISTNTNHGIVKYTGNSARTFKVTGFQLELGSTATPYTKTTQQAWTRTNIDWLPDQIAAPFGSQLADRILETSANGIHSIYTPYMPKQLHSYLYSVYLKKGVGSSAPNIIKLTTHRDGAFSNTTWADFNIASGTVAFSTGCIATIEDASNGWYRCSIAYVPTQRGSNALEGQDYVYIQFTNNVIGGLPSGSIYTGTIDADVFAYGAQLQEHECVLPEYADTWPLSSNLSGTYQTGTFTRSTSATIDGLDYGINSPRYISNGILIEEGTTNLLTNSDGASGTYSATDLSPFPPSYTSGAITPISGFINSMQFGDNSLARYALKSITLSPNTTYAFSFYIQMDDNGTPSDSGSSSEFDYQIRINGSAATNKAAITPVSGSIYRISIVLPVGTPVNSNRVGIHKLTTNSSRGFKVTGYQLELKPYATSYAESAASAFVRSTDSLLIPTTGLSNTAWTLDLTANRTTLGLPSGVNTLCEAVIDANNYYRLVLDASGRISALIASSGEVYAGVTSKVLLYGTAHQIKLKVNGSTAQLFVDGVKLSEWNYNKPLGLMPSNFSVPGGVSAVYSNIAVDSKAFIQAPFEHGYAPVYTTELVDENGIVNRAEYQTILKEGIHKFGTSWGPNYILGNTSNLMNTTESLSYYNVSNVSAAITPLPGFIGSLQFTNLPLQRYAYKSAPFTYGEEYAFSFYIQMDDNSVPIPGTSAASGADFAIVLAGSVHSTGTNHTTELVSGSLYKISIPWTSTTTTSGSSNNGISKYVGNSSKGFRVAGYSLTRKTLVKESVTVFGNNMLNTNEYNSGYSNLTSTSAAVTPIAGFVNSIQFGNNSVARTAYKTPLTTQIGKRYKFSCYVQMDDGSVPVVGSYNGTVSEASADMAIAIGGNYPSSLSNVTITLVSGTVYKISCIGFATSASGGNGILKVASNSAKTFKVAGFELFPEELIENTNIKLFIDGVEVGNKVTQSSLKQLSSISFIGSDHSSKNQWDGCIARLSAYPKKLDDVIIETITE